MIRHSLFVSIGLMAAASGFGCRNEPPATTAPAPKVSVRHPEKRELTDYVEFNGWLQPRESIEVRARVRGHIQKVHFTDGQMVNKGDPLFDLDPRPFEAAMEAAKAEMASAEANLELARKEYNRAMRLAQTGAASREEAEVWTAKQAVAAANKLKAAASVDQAKLDLEYAKITADIAGRIGKAELTEGNLVNAGGSDPLLTTIMALDPIRITFNVDERLLQRHARVVGMDGKNMTELLAALKDAKVEFTFAQDGEREFTHKGVLAFGDNRIDPSTGTLQVYGTADNKSGRYIPGARVKVRVPIGGKANPVLVVPDTAILADQDKRYVLIVDGENNVRRRNVTLGALTDDSMRVIKPADKLENGERVEDWWVIVDNLQRARLNYPADPQKPGPTGTAG
jgi:RND family efflux transporter MFP subunit